MSASRFLIFVVTPKMVLNYTYHTLLIPRYFYECFSILDLDYVGCDQGTM